MTQEFYPKQLELPRESHRQGTILLARSRVPVRVVVNQRNPFGPDPHCPAAEERRIQEGSIQSLGPIGEAGTAVLVQHPEREGDSLDHGFQFVLEAPELRLEGLVALLELFGGRREGLEGLHQFLGLGQGVHRFSAPVPAGRGTCPAPRPEVRRPRTP